ncbi:MAG: DNA polymerase III subunit beta [Atribacterota bacterium]
MQATIDLKELKVALEKTIRGVSNRATLPILSGILIEADGPQNIRFSANDLEMGIVTGCLASIEEESSIVVPGKIFYNIVRSLNGQKVLVCSNPENITEVTCGKSYYKLSGFPATDFPSFPPFDHSRFLSFPGVDLKEGVNQTCFAASKDEARPALTGVLLEIKEGFAYLVATDGHRLSLRKILVPGFQPGQEIYYILPARVAVEIMRSITAEKVLIYPGNGEILVEMGSFSLYSRLIEGEFPDYQQVMPSEFLTKVTVKREQFISVLERMSLVAPPDMGLIQIHFEREFMTVVCESPEVGIAREETEVFVDGQNIDIAFNVRFLLDCLRVAPWEDVTLGINGEVSPVKVFGKTDEFQSIIMPIKIHKGEE